MLNLIKSFFLKNGEPAHHLNALLKAAVFEEFPMVFPEVKRFLWMCPFCCSEALPDENQVLNCKCTNKTKANWLYVTTNQVWACSGCMAATFAGCPILGRCICVIRDKNLISHIRWRPLQSYITTIDYPYHELKEPKDMGVGWKPRA